jgi:Zn-dependent alcohol dehydrogenase
VSQRFSLSTTVTYRGQREQQHACGETATETSRTGWSKLGCRAPRLGVDRKRFCGVLWGGDSTAPPSRVITSGSSLGRVVRFYLDGLRLEEVERPIPREGEVLVKVHAAAITRGELEWPAGRLPAVPSHELSGVVMDTGEEVFALTPFDRDGVAADYVSVPSAILAPKPHSLSHVEAAALPMGGLSAWQALFVHGHLHRGERVLVTGASGGVGHLAVQLARHAGATVIEDGPADLVFDTVGGDLPVARRIVTIAAETPGARYFVVKPERDQLAELGRLADAGELLPAIDSTFPLERARDAFERVAARGKRGKVVLDVAGG